MIIGLDFDNTIISYQKIFYKLALKKKIIPKNISKEKNSVKKYLLAKNLENEWTQIQGEAYGSEIVYAKPYPGLIEFLKYIKKNKFKVYIVSHKTIYPYKGEKINLRNSAFEWIKQYDIIKYIPKRNIYFENSINSKVRKIKQLKCDLFIDDLPSVLELLSKKIIKVLFDPNSNNVLNHNHTYKNWKQILFI